MNLCPRNWSLVYLFGCKNAGLYDPKPFRQCRGAEAVIFRIRFFDGLDPDPFFLTGWILIRFFDVSEYSRFFLSILFETIVDPALFLGRILTLK